MVRAYRITGDGLGSIGIDGGLYKGKRHPSLLLVHVAPEPDPSSLLGIIENLRRCVRRRNKVRAVSVYAAGDKAMSIERNEKGNVIRLSNPGEGVHFRASTRSS